MNSDTLRARVPVGLTPGNYAVRVANPRSAIAVYGSKVRVSDAPGTRNIVRFTHGVGKSNELVHVYVDTATRDSVEGLQINLSYPADRLQFLEPPQSGYRSNYLNFVSRLQEPGRLVLVWFTDQATGLPPGHGPLARLTFRIKDPASAGQPISIACDSVKFSDSIGNSLTGMALPGEIDVCTNCTDGIEAGDATGDGSVDILDYRRVFSEFWERSHRIALSRLLPTLITTAASTCSTQSASCS